MGGMTATRYWNGAQIVFPDTDYTPRICTPNSGALDLNAHEFTHGVTQYTSGLTGSDDPSVPDETAGLNESFSDMMAATAEFYADDHGLDPTVAPDWYFGEDVFFGGGVVPGGRNMSDPAEDGNPDHYSELTPGMNIHHIGEVSNHAYYLSVAGGRNAGCDNVGSDGHTHTLDCDVVVTPLGLDTAARDLLCRVHQLGSMGEHVRRTQRHRCRRQRSLRHQRGGEHKRRVGGGRPAQWM